MGREDISNGTAQNLGEGHHQEAHPHIEGLGGKVYVITAISLDIFEMSAQICGLNRELSLLLTKLVQHQIR